MTAVAGTPSGASSAPVTARAGWTREELEHRLAASVGVRRDGQVNMRVGSELLGVSPRTLRRWLHREAGELVGMTAKNREAVHTQLRPGTHKLEQEERDRAYAVEAVRKIAVPKRRRRIPEVWEERGWLNEHMVAVIETAGGHAHQLAVARMDMRPLQRMRRRGQVVDFTQVATRFHATLLVAAVLEEMDQWRVQLASSWTSQGHSQAWTVDGPAVNLAAVAVTNRLR